MIKGILIQVILKKKKIYKETTNLFKLFLIL